MRIKKTETMDFADMVPIVCFKSLEFALREGGYTNWNQDNETDLVSRVFGRKCQKPENPDVVPRALAHTALKRENKDFANMVFCRV